MTRADFSDEEILKSAQFIANFWLLATMAYLKSHQQSIADWVQFGGEHVARGFEAREPASALELVRTVALGPVSLGGTLLRLEGDVMRARVTVEFLAEEMVTAFGLSLNELDLFLSGVYGPLTRSLDLKYASHRTGECWMWEIFR